MFKSLKNLPHPSRLALAAALAITALPAAAQTAPLTTHPRLWLTQADLPRLRSWAVNSNPIYKNGLLVAAHTAAAHADAHWNYTTGVPDSGWQDDGDVNWEGDDTEAYAEFFAFMSLIDPSATKRAAWANRAHVLLMWAMNQAALPDKAGRPFCEPGFITYNRANYWGEAWGLTVDWIYPALTAADKATIRKTILKWGATLLNASTAGQEHPQPVGLLNDLRLIGGSASQVAAQRQAAQLQFRWAANNYFLGHFRNLSLLTLALDPADDKPKGSGVTGSAGGLLQDAIGAWMYQAYAMFEDPAVTAKTLKPVAGNIALGNAFGGLPVEGALYGVSLGTLYETLLAFNTAGYSNAKKFGPQIGLIDSHHWDLAPDGLLNNTSPGAAILPDATYLGPVYRPAGYGDEEDDWITPDDIALVGPMAIHDRVADPTRYAKDRWIATNMLEGGPTFLNSRVANIWGNSYASNAILYFLAFDPAQAAPADPRPSIASNFAMPAIGRVLARSGWGANTSWFTFRCGPETINHVSGDCGQFEFYRKGVWLTKQWSGYAIDGKAYDPQYHNIVAIQNTTPKDIPDLYATQIKYGGQFNNGGSVGDPGVRYSVNDGWVYAQTDAANLYNYPNYYTPADAGLAVKTARRAVVWLNPDHVIVHDIADTTKAGLFKQFNLVLMATPKIAGNTMTTVFKGQQLTLQSLLPANAQLAEQKNWTKSPADEFDAPSLEELAHTRLIITTPTYGASQSFLEVLQGTDAGTKADAATLVTSSAGNMFEGAVVAGTAVLFPADTAAFASVTYTVPASVTRQLVTGLTPGGGYTVLQSAGPGGATMHIVPGGTAKADASGVLALGFPASVNPVLTAVRDPVKYSQPPWGGGF